jgi:hypothetical protein
MHWDPKEQREGDLRRVRSSSGASVGVCGRGGVRGWAGEGEEYPAVQTTTDRRPKTTETTRQKRNNQEEMRRDARARDGGLLFFLSEAAERVLIFGCFDQTRRWLARPPPAPNLRAVIDSIYYIDLDFRSMDRGAHQIDR